MQLPARAAVDHLGAVTVVVEDGHHQARPVARPGRLGDGVGPIPDVALFDAVGIEQLQWRAHGDHAGGVSGFGRGRGQTVDRVAAGAGAGEQRPRDDRSGAAPPHSVDPVSNSGPSSAIPIGRPSSIERWAARPMATAHIPSSTVTFGGPPERTASRKSTCSRYDEPWWRPSCRMSAS